METTNKKVLIDALVEETGMTKKAAGDTIDFVFDSITAALKKGHKVDISGFGKFEVKHRPERKGINPATKETITIKASNAPGFKASKVLKDSLN
ncbi:MAG: HU family DNA-binding protein [Anaerorhabdus sp.]